MSRPRTIVDAFDGPFVAWLGDPAEWSAWRTFLKAMAALPLDDAELELFTRCTGRSAPPEAPVTEAWCIAGRRARKSATAAMIGVFQAVYPDWSRFIAKGETARVLIVGVAKDQAGLVRSYCEAILRSRPGLARLIVGCDADAIRLRNGIEIKCVANSFRSIRGPTCVCAIFDEVAFWRDETSANPDAEVLRAVKPSMLTVKGAVLIGLSSPHAKRGLLYAKHRDHYGRDGKVLVWSADTITMNPKADREEIEERFRDDPEAARSEYGVPDEGIWFREDLGQFLNIELVQSLARRSPLELSPREGITYRARADPSGGRGDAYAVAIGHREADGLIVVDLVRATPAPFDPAVVTKEYAQLLGGYGIHEVVGDAYSAEWASRAWQAEGINYRTSPRDRSQLYLEALPAFTRGQVQLPDDRRLLVELSTLERRTSQAGKDSVNHTRGAHDDRANVVAGVIVELTGRTVFEGSFRDACVLGRPLAALEADAMRGIIQADRDANRIHTSIFDMTEADVEPWFRGPSPTPW